MGTWAAKKLDALVLNRVNTVTYIVHCINHILGQDYHNLVV